MNLSLLRRVEILAKCDYRQFGPSPVVGVDEVGRGCLAGSVYAGAVMLKDSPLSHEFEGLIKDSKLLSEKRREEIAPQICKYHLVGIGFATVDEIDKLNILQASFLAMKRALQALDKKLLEETGQFLGVGGAGGHVLVDGRQKIPDLVGLPQTAIIKGDLRCLPISAASIVAKVVRDQYMRDLAHEYPVYGFEKHKGYGSQYHRQAIKVHGPSPYHRKTFRGVKEFLSNRS